MLTAAVTEDTQVYVFKAADGSRWVTVRDLKLLGIQPELVAYWKQSGRVVTTRMPLPGAGGRRVEAVRLDTLIRQLESIASRSDMRKPRRFDAGKVLTMMRKLYEN